MSTLYFIIALFALGAIIGMYLLSLLLQNKETPKFFAFIHGGFVAVALILLIFYSAKNGPGPMESIILFIVAALGGFTLIVRELTGRTLPKWLALGHGLVAVAGFIFLLIYAFSK